MRGSAPRERFKTRTYLQENGHKHAQPTHTHTLAGCDRPGHTTRTAPGYGPWTRSRSSCSRRGLPVPSARMCRGLRSWTCRTSRAFSRPWSSRTTATCARARWTCCSGSSTRWVGQGAARLTGYLCFSRVMREWRQTLYYLGLYENGEGLYFLGLCEKSRQNGNNAITISVPFNICFLHFLIGSPLVHPWFTCVMCTCVS